MESRTPLHPAALSFGLPAMASAVARINPSLKQLGLVAIGAAHLMVHRYRCHEHHPSGGVFAAPLSSAEHVVAIASASPMKVGIFILGREDDWAKAL